MKIGTVKGTSDYLPNEVILREFIQNSILETYKINGFERIMTPAIEGIENLDKSDGGDNLNLIFKILKRGEKLNSAIENAQFNELSDMGLRYDLTLPLSRYFANNRQNLTLPFKCIQIDKVYRAERPQKGRMRELVQCDIDIIGSDSVYCEIELINVTAKALLAIGLKNFKVRINDRNILRNILLSIGFKQDELESVCITFDKLDKIGINGIKAELSEKGASEESINALSSILRKLPLSLDYIKSISSQKDSINNLQEIINKITLLSENKYTIEFDLSLVRGQGYYTGTVFEIESSDFNSSIAGGGRYDNLIGKFLNEKIPAVGFSIGFERIFHILKDNRFYIPNARKKIAVFFENNFLEANKKADKLRNDYDVTLFEKPKKLSKFLNSLLEMGFYGFFVYGQSEEIKILN
ncbi:MAG: histidine--tRNA ligase [Lachnospiraceae bacterium]|nr:histidine--tRNA ligase [Lachnospiraceae bacterium]